jgi:hypothetical protein
LNEGGILERKIRKRGLDLGEDGFFCWKEKEKPEEGKRQQGEFGRGGRVQNFLVGFY